MAAKQPAGSSNAKKTKKKTRDDDDDNDDVDEVIDYTFSVGDLVNVAVAGFSPSLSIQVIRIGFSPGFS